MSQGTFSSARHAVQASAPRAPGYLPKSSVPPRAIGAGKTLDPVVRADMESRFGADFADVRVHDDAAAQAEARQLGARAFTVGADLVFGTDRFAPHTAAGKLLLAHELAHVIQQRRGGPAPELSSDAAHEVGAGQAAARVAAGASGVRVSGATGVGIARDRDEKKQERRSRRSNEKAAATQRAAERADARGGAQQSLDSKAKRAIGTMFEEARRGDLALSSRDAQLKELHRFKAALRDAKLTQLEKNKLQGRYDELLRTPRHDLVGKPQSQWVAGGEALPGMDLPPGKARYAQPDASKMIKRGGLLKRYHVNLKSDTLDGLTPGKARAKGQAYAKQAARNARHLPEGEGIVLDFAEPGTPAVRNAICEGAFTAGGNISEIRFHTQTIERATWESELHKRPARPAKGGKKAGAKHAGSNKAISNKAVSNKAGKAETKAGGMGKKPVKKVAQGEVKTKPTAKKPARGKSASKPSGKAGKTGKVAAPREPGKVGARPAAPEAAKPRIDSGPRPAEPLVRPAKPAGMPIPEARVAPGEALLPAEPRLIPDVVPKGGLTPKGVAKGALGAAGGLGALSGVKDIVNDLKAGDVDSAALKAGILRLSFVGEAVPPLLAAGVIMNYWGPRHEKIESDAFAVGEMVEEAARNIPLLGRSETARRVLGGIYAAEVAVGESIAYTAKDMGEAVVDGGETLYAAASWLGNELFAPSPLLELALKHARGD